MSEEWLGPGEMAKRLQVTPKALRVYEREGLVAPARTLGGWRAYGPAQASRLHQIMALRGLGLSLQRIRALLVDGHTSLVDVLALQLETLTAQRSKFDGAIELLRLAMLTLNDGRALTLDDLTSLTTETVMERPAPMLALKAKTESLIAERLPDADLSPVIQKLEEQIRASGQTKADIFDQVIRLAAQGKKIMRTESADSEAAKDFVRLWRASFANLKRSMSTPHDPVTITMRASMLEAMNDPAICDQLPFDPAVFDFILRVTKGMKERGEPI